MLDWYDAIKSEINTCPTSICTTCTTFKSEDIEKIGQIGRIDSTQTEKQFFSDFAPQHEITDYKSVPLFADAQGKSIYCVSCDEWQPTRGTAWWCRTCAMSGKPKNNKSKCDLIAWEEIKNDIQ